MEDSEQAELLGELKALLSGSELDFSCLTDSDLRRFLVASKWKPQKAFKNLVEWHGWYFKPDGAPCAANILDNSVDPNEEIYQRLCPHDNFGVDKEMRPIYWEQTGLISKHFVELHQHFSVEVFAFASLFQKFAIQS
eukprot:c10771_g1_i2.p2 GENE.c10771_g1_i2~~c10771_g1_i2.p2  ORF type:complete len:145 (+),score=34.79 c10771_g1_i2:26-436(+)